MHAHPQAHVLNRHGGARPKAGRRARLRIELLLPAVAAVLCLTAFAAPAASANQYTGMLAPGTIGIGGASQTTGGYVYGSYSWTAPAGTNFHGFAYTGAAFSVISDNGVGGMSVGFGGDGSANQPTILFPWTQDCSITNSGHYWTRDGRLAGLNGQQTCSTSGNTSGWNYTNAEIYNTAPGTNPQVEYHTLWFTAFCQAATCNYSSSNEWGSGSASVTNLSGNIDDPNNQPSGGAYWTGNNGAWYQTDSNSPTINVNASDPAGVCAIGAWLTGPGSSYLQLMNASPSMENAGGPIGNEFDSITPCPGAGGSTVSGSSTLPAAMASGTYNLAIVASNPGNWEGGAGLSNAPTIASYGSTIHIDDSVPTISWSNPSTGWTAATSEQFTVNAGPSGISNVSCSDNGTAVAVTNVGANTYSVPTGREGQNAMSCTASNGDANGALTGPAGTHTYYVDTITPTVTFSDSGYTPATWTNAPQAVTVSATGGPSGIGAIRCRVDGTSTPLAGAASNQITVSGDGKHVLDCVATSNTNIAGEATEGVWVDTRQPTVSFSGAVPAPTWLSGTPTVMVVGGESGGTLSGITKLSCSVNGGAAFTLNVNAAQNYTSSFVLTPNGADHVDCQASDAAGSTGPMVSETVNVDNPAVMPASATLSRYGSSPDINNGASPFSDGPSQTTWSHNPEAVTVTAVNTAGGAPISQITCTGASQAAAGGTYPANTQNAYGNGGERITATVQPPGGELSCTAQDTAGNTYPLGSYEFEIDNQAPTGYFKPEASWPAPDEVQVHVSDGAQGSGTAAVEVTAQQNGGPLYKVMATRDPSQTNVWDAHFNDSTIPAGSYTFIAYPTDAAGNSGQITTNQAGAVENLELPLREMTALSDTLTADGTQAAGSQTPTVNSTAAATAATARRTNDRTGATLARVASCRKHKARGKHKAKPCSHTKRPARTKTAFVTVAYGQTAQLSGTLKDSRGRKPIAHAKIVIDEQVLGHKTVTKLGTVRTNRKGRYTFHVKPGPSRTLLAIYNGTHLLRGAQVNVGEHVKGKASLHVTGILKPGHKLIVSGHLKGGYVPAAGALITIQYAVQGFRGWTNWGDTRTTRKGKFAVRMPILPADAGHTFKWRAVIKAQTGWAFLAGHSDTITRAIR